MPIYCMPICRIHYLQKTSILSIRYTEWKYRMHCPQKTCLYRMPIYANILYLGSCYVKILYCFWAMELMLYRCSSWHCLIGNLYVLFSLRICFIEPGWVASDIQCCTMYLVHSKQAWVILYHYKCNLPFLRLFLLIWSGHYCHRPSFPAYLHICMMQRHSSQCYS